MLNLLVSTNRQIPYQTSHSPGTHNLYLWCGAWFGRVTVAVGLVLARLVTPAAGQLRVRVVHAVTQATLSLRQHVTPVQRH